MLFLEVDTHGPVPIYEQIMDGIQRLIREEKLLPGVPLPSVRQLASDLEINPNTVARAVLFGDAAIAPLGPPCVDVVATAKVDLDAGREIDYLGGYLTYGQCENSDVTRKEGLLPIGLAEGCRLRHAIPKDRVLTYDDVDLPPDRLCDRLRAEQERHFSRRLVEQH